MQRIYLSPHADDVALSCGGQIVSTECERSNILILSIFTSESDDLHQASHALQNAFGNSITSERAVEDQQAWKSAGVEVHFAKLPEALLRRKFPFTIRGRYHEAGISDRVYAHVLRYAQEYPDADFYFPAAIGNHIDHILCRDIAFRLLDEGHIEKANLYEDIPYSWLRFIRKRAYASLKGIMDFRDGDEAAISREDGCNPPAYLAGKILPFPKGKLLFLSLHLIQTVKHILRPRGKSPSKYHGKMRVIHLDGNGVSRKKNLIDHYRSQIPMLFGKDPEKTLQKYRTSFSTEVVMEIFRKEANQS